MYCNKCRYVSHDYLSSCPKCGQDWSEEKKKMGLDWIVKQERGWLEAKPAADSHVPDEFSETATETYGVQFRDEEDVLVEDNESKVSADSMSDGNMVDGPIEILNEEGDNQLESKFLDQVEAEGEAKISSDSSRKISSDDEIEFPDLEFIDSPQKR